jgi:hypothetical protein
MVSKKMHKCEIDTFSSSMESSIKLGSDWELDIPKFEKDEKTKIFKMKKSIGQFNEMPTVGEHIPDVEESKTDSIPVISSEDGLTDSKKHTVVRRPIRIKNKFNKRPIIITTEPTETGGGTSPEHAKDFEKLREILTPRTRARHLKELTSAKKNLKKYVMSDSLIDEINLENKKNLAKPSDAVRSKAKKTSIIKDFYHLKQPSFSSDLSHFSNHSIRISGTASPIKPSKFSKQIERVLSRRRTHRLKTKISSSQIKEQIKRMDTDKKIKSIKTQNSVKSVKEKLKIKAENKSSGELNLKLSFFDYITFYLPNSFFNSLKKRVYQNGRSMIQEKLNIKYLINNLIEFEKLKLLLFDETQNYLFEHIPSPILSDREVLGLWDKKDEQEAGEALLTCNDQFWQKRSEKEKDEDFLFALETIRNKGDDANIIDRRLVEILTNFRNK